LPDRIWWWDAERTVSRYESYRIANTVDASVAQRNNVVA
jgi:hypothetical protein